MIMKRSAQKDINNCVYYTSNIGAPEYTKGEIHSNTTSYWYDE